MFTKKFPLEKKNTEWVKLPNAILPNSDNKSDKNIGISNSVCCERVIAHGVIKVWHALIVGEGIFIGAHISMSILYYVSIPTRQLHVMKVCYM